VKWNPSLLKQHNNLRKSSIVSLDDLFSAKLFSSSILMIRSLVSGKGSGKGLKNKIKC